MRKISKDTKRDIETIRCKLSGGFVWSDTKKGHDFWRNVAEELDRLAAGKGWKEKLIVHKADVKSYKVMQYRNGIRRTTHRYLCNGAVIPSGKSKLSCVWEDVTCNNCLKHNNR